MTWDYKMTCGPCWKTGHGRSMQKGKIRKTGMTFSGIEKYV